MTELHIGEEHPRPVAHVRHGKLLELGTLHGRPLYINSSGRFVLTDPAALDHPTSSIAAVT